MEISKRKLIAREEAKLILEGMKKKKRRKGEIYPQ